MNQRLILYSDAVNRHELSCFEETVIISFFVGSNLRLKPRDVRAMVLNRDGFMSRSPSPDWDVANAWTLIETLSMQSGSFVAGTKSKQKKKCPIKRFLEEKKSFHSPSTYVNRSDLRYAEIHFHFFLSHLNQRARGETKTHARLVDGIWASRAATDFARQLH